MQGFKKVKANGITIEIVPLSVNYILIKIFLIKHFRHWRWKNFNLHKDMEETYVKVLYLLKFN